MTTSSRGVVFEKLVVSRLTCDWHGLTLQNSGGRGDGGVDFFGTWLTPNNTAVAVLGQCKDHSRKGGSIIVRDFAATLSNNELGVLVHSSGFTRECVSFAGHRVNAALVLLHIDTLQVLRFVHLNSVAQARWPELGVASVFVGERRSALMWKDQVVIESKD
jgi:restriction endonuclease Mrr